MTDVDHTATTTDGAKTVIVTGASSGFGRAIAENLAASGHHVVGVARNGEALLRLAAELGPGFVAAVGDVTDDRLAKQLIGLHAPDAVVLNAGARPTTGALSELTWEDYNVNWAVDARQAFVWTTTALKAPLRAGSRVISIGSGASLSGSPMSGGYAPAKAAVRFISEYAANESAARGLGISFSVVLPGLTPLTDLGRVGVAAYAPSAGGYDAMLARLEPHLTPERVGSTIAGLIDDEPQSGQAWLLTGERFEMLSR